MSNEPDPSNKPETQLPPSPICAFLFTVAEAIYSYQCLGPVVPTTCRRLSPLQGIFGHPLSPDMLVLCSSGRASRRREEPDGTYRCTRQRLASNTTTSSGTPAESSRRVQIEPIREVHALHTPARCVGFTRMHVGNHFTL